MKTRWIAATLIGGYGVALLAMAPAWLVTNNLADLSAGAAVGRQAEGTIWSGAARIELPRQGIALQRVTWRFQPQALLRGEWRYAVRVEDPAISVNASVGRGFTHVVVRDATARLPAPTAAALVPALGMFSPTGNVELTSNSLRCAGQDCEGDLAVQWRDAALSLAELRPLGDYTATATLQGARAEFEVKTLTGAFRLAGRGTWQAPQRIGFNGEASAAPDVAPRVQGLLKLLGNPDERGTVKINVAPR